LPAKGCAPRADRGIVGIVEPEDGAMKRENISFALPAALKRQIDALVGRRGRAAFLREAAEQEIERKRLLASLRKRPAGLAR
jgi:hypothetical protein